MWHVRGTLREEEGRRGIPDECSLPSAFISAFWFFFFTSFASSHLLLLLLLLEQQTKNNIFPVFGTSPRFVELDIVLRHQSTSELTYCNQPTSILVLNCVCVSGNVNKIHHLKSVIFRANSSQQLTNCTSYRLLHLPGGHIAVIDIFTIHSSFILPYSWPSPSNNHRQE